VVTQQGGAAKEAPADRKRGKTLGTRLFHPLTRGLPRTPGLKGKPTGRRSAVKAIGIFVTGKPPVGERGTEGLRRKPAKPLNVRGGAMGGDTLREEKECHSRKRRRREELGRDLWQCGLPLFKNEKQKTPFYPGGPRLGTLDVGEGAGSPIGQWIARGKKKF